MAHHLVSSSGPVGADARRDALAEVIASKARKGFWVESESEAEARLIARGRKRWLVWGGRVPETRQIVRVDLQGRTSIESLPARRY
jgi:hypothetical protein